VQADLVIARSVPAPVAGYAQGALRSGPVRAGGRRPSRRNAEAVARAGGAVVVPQSDASPERLTREVMALVEDGAARVRMADAARALGRPNAAGEVARDFLELAGIAGRRNGAKGPRISEVRHV
jgi:UDP-N-acetylglucosamine--N-acetylmuramyl-(pentapeptide) pyrophosphoryl-undecaprenol N-acetylglucosamine transferase